MKFKRQSHGRWGMLCKRTALVSVAATGLFVSLGASAIAQTTACDLNNDGVTNVVDVQLAINMAFGVTPCTATVDGPGLCNNDVIQKIETAALGGSCVVSGGPTPHSVTLNWSPSTSLNVSGYNVYRATTSGGPYTNVTSSPVAATTFIDSNVQAGQTYYYVATAVDIDANESIYSNEAQAIVPTP